MFPAYSGIQDQGNSNPRTASKRFMEGGYFRNYIKKKILRLVIGPVPDKDLGIPSGAHS